MTIASEEAILLKHIWKKAYTEDVVIKLESKKEAARIRFALYNAASPYKKGEIFDDDMTAAVLNVGVTYDSPTVLRLSRRLTSTLSALVEASGFDLEKAIKAGEDASVSPEEAEAQESLNRLLKKMDDEAKEDKGDRATAYYTRPAVEGEGS